MPIGNHTLPTDMLDTCDGLLYCFANWAHEVTDGWFWTLMLLGFCFILLMGTYRFGGVRSFGFASVVGLLASMWLSTLGLMPWWIASAFILTGAVGMVVMILHER